MKFVEEVHISPAVWDVSSVVYKDAKSKRNKMEEQADKLGFVRTFPHLCLFLIFSSSVSLFYVS